MTEPLRAVYDLRYSPITFDFAVYLALVDCARQLSDAPAIDLTIRADRFRKQTERDRMIPKAEKEWRLKSIILSCCDLLPSLRDVAVERSGAIRDYDFPANYPEAYDPYYRPPYLASHVLDLHKMGAAPRALTAPAYAKDFPNRWKNYVTLTLRTSKHFAVRNADMEEWFKFHDRLLAKGYVVLVVPDTEDVLGERRFMSYPWLCIEPAALDQRLRLALYEGAAMNVCSANGPAAMMFYSHAPVLQFDQLRGGVFNAEKWKGANGFGPGGQFPWSAPNQRMTWVDSTYENLVREFEKVMS